LPLAATPVIFTVELLVLLTITFLSAEVVPTTTSPKPRLAGEKASGTELPDDPVPERLAFWGLKLALWVTAKAPRISPFWFGLNLTLTVHCDSLGRVLVQGFLPLVVTS
jgi:hypothetical protein